MTRDEQKLFILELTRRQCDTMLALIDDGTVPESWDGIELRQWIADRARQDSILESRRARRGGDLYSRARGYTNDRNINPGL
jgi:hypothetical protein